MPQSSPLSQAGYLICMLRIRPDGACIMHGPLRRSVETEFQSQGCASAAGGPAPRWRGTVRRLHREPRLPAARERRGSRRRTMVRFTQTASYDGTARWRHALRPADNFSGLDQRRHWRERCISTGTEKVRQDSRFPFFSVRSTPVAVCSPGYRKRLTRLESKATVVSMKRDWRTVFGPDGSGSRWPPASTGLA
jgi:hypothetical protein